MGVLLAVSERARKGGFAGAYLIDSCFFMLPFTPDFIDSAATGLVPKLAKGRWSEMDKGKRGVSTAQTSCVGCKHFFFFPCFAATTSPHAYE